MLFRFRRMAAATGLLALSAAMGACGKADDPPAVDMASVAFAVPVDGATLRTADDTDPLTDGMQANVEVLVTNNVGPGTLALIVNGAAQPAETIALIGDEDQATRRFADVSLVLGTNTIKAVLDVEGDELDLDTTITVTVEDSGSTDDPAMEIVAPRDGARLTAADDLDALAEGVQVAVSVALEFVPDGTSVELTVNDGTPVTRAVAGSTLTFGGVTLPEGASTIRVGATVDGAAISDSVSVTVQTIEPPDPSLEITAPVDGALIGPDEDTSDAEGIQVDVAVAAVAIPDATTVVLLINGSPGPTATVEAEAVAFDDVTVPVGIVALTARTSLSGTEYTDSIEITVDVPSCAVALTPTPLADACFATTALGDADPDTAGVQVVFSGATDCGEMELKIDGVVVETIEPSEGSGDFAAVTVGEGIFTAQLVARSEGADGATPEYTYTVDTFAPEIAVTQPADGATFWLADDADPDTDGVQVVLAGTSDLGADAVVSISADGLDAPAITEPTDGSGAWTTTLTFTSDTAAAYTVTGSDLCGNPGQAQVAFQVYTYDAALALTAPADGARFGIADDEDSDAAGIQATFSLTSGYPDGTTVVVRCVDGAGATYPIGAPTLESGAASFVATLREGSSACTASIEGAVPATSETIAVVADSIAPGIAVTSPASNAQLAASDVTVTAALTADRTGEVLGVSVSVDGGAAEAATVDGAAASFLAAGLAEGAHTIVVTVSDELGNTGIASVDFVVDTVAPGLASLAPADGATLALGDVLNTTDGLVADVRATLSGATGPTLVCAQANAGAEQCVTAAADGAVTIGDFVVLPGVNSLSFRAVDAAGNEGIASATFTLDVDLPRLTISTPASGSAVATSPIVVTGTSDLPGGVSVAIRVNGVTGPSTLTGADGSFSVSDLALAAGSNTLQATGTDGRGAGFSSPVTVTYDTVAPTIAFVSPTSGAVLNLSAPDASADTGFQTAITLSTTDNDAAADAVAVTLTCTGGVSQTLEGTTTAGSITFPAVTLPVVAVCTLEARVTDAAGNLGTASASITIDRVAPTVTWQQPGDGTTLTPAVDVSADPGIQANLRIRADGSAVGQVISVEIVDVDGGVTELSSSALTAASQAVTVPAVALPDGPVVLRAQVSDAAGNTSAVAQIQVYVVSEFAGVFLTRPVSGVTLKASDDTNGSLAGLQFTVVGSVIGGFNGNTAALCIESADTDLTPCGEAGFRQLATSTVSAGAVSWPGVTLPEGFVRLLGEIVLPSTDIVPSQNTVSATVDSQAPTLDDFVLTSDDNDDGFLNIAEDLVAGGSANATASLTTSGLEDGRTVTIRSNLPAAGSVVGTGVVAGGTVTVNLTLVGGVHTLTASATDAAGNAFAAGGPTVAVTVDLTAPSLAISAPATGATLTAADDEDGGTAGLQTTIAVTSNAGAGRRVALSADDGIVVTPLGSLSLGATGGTRSATLPEGVQDLSATVSDVAGNAATASATVTIDSVAPGVAFVSPTVGETRNLSTGDDQSPGLPGLQVGVLVSVTGAQSGDEVEIYSSLRAAPVGTAIASGDGNLDITVTLTSTGTHVLSAIVRDGVGNEGTASGGTLDYSVVDCGLSLTAPVEDVFVGIVDDIDGDETNGAQITFTFDSADPSCDGATATLYAQVDSVATPVETTTITSGVGDFGVVDVPDGTDAIFFVGVDSPLVSTSDSRGVLVDLTAPVIVSVFPSNGEDVQFLGIADLNGAGFDFSVGLLSDPGGSVFLEDGDSLFEEILLDSSTVIFTGVELADGIYTLAFTAVDEIGNVSDTVFYDYEVDTSAPAAPTLETATINARSGNGTVSITDSVADAGYEFGYAVGPCPATFDWDSATTLPEDSEGPTGRAFTGLAPMQTTFCFAARGTDEAGNVGETGTVEFLAGFAFADVDTGFTNAFWTTHVGDIDADGYSDWAIGGQSSGQPRVVLVYGAELAEDVRSETRLPPVGASAFWGVFVFASGDVNGDGFDDLALSDAPLNTVYLHLGSETGLETTATTVITYTGGASASFGGHFHAGHGDVLMLDGDESTENHADLVLAAPYETETPNGRVFVVAGRDAWPPTIAIGTDAAANAALGVATLGSTVINSRFGFRTLIQPPTNGDGFAELAVTARASGVAGAVGALYYFVGGRICAAAGPGCPFDGTTRLHSTADAGPYGAGAPGSEWSLKGTTGGEDIDGDGLPDFLVNDVLDVAFDVILGSDPMPGAVSYSETFTAYPTDTLRLGENSALVGDVRLNYALEPGETPFSDALVALRQAPGQPTLNEMLLFLNNGTGGFSDAAGAVISLGAGLLPVTGGDMNGDGNRDFGFFVPDGTFRICY